MFFPAQIANNYLQTGKGKAALPGGKMLVLAMMAGIFVALAAAGANTMSAAFESPALARIAAALIFPTALMMVLIAGSELFTGNTLLVLPLYEREITLRAMARNWCIVYAGNFLGSLLVVLLMYAGGQWGSFSGEVAQVTIKVAATKTGYSFAKCLALGIGCNFLVCIAVWLSFAADSAGGKLAVLYLPVALFVLLGFEHSVANMYYVPAGLMAAQNPLWAAEAVAAGIDMGTLSLGGFLWGNLFPVTLGNIIGGSVFVATPYWYVYIHNNQAKKQKTVKAA